MARTGETAYTARVSVVGGREGHAISDDRRLDLSLARPGSASGGVNPEQLFAAALGACFQSALMSVARQRGLDASASVVDASASLVRGAGGYSLGVALRITISGMPLEQIRELAASAEQLCPYAQAIRGNVTITMDVAN